MMPSGADQQWSLRPACGQAPVTTRTPVKAKTSGGRLAEIRSQGCAAEKQRKGNQSQIESPDRGDKSAKP